MPPTKSNVTKFPLAASSALRRSVISLPKSTSVSMMTEPAPSKETLDGYVEVVNRSAEPALEKITFESALTCGKSAS